MQCQHASYHCTDVYCEHHVVVFGCKAFNEVLIIEIWQQVHNLLEQKHDFVVGWQFSIANILQIGDNFKDLAIKSSQSQHLLLYAALQRIQGNFLDLSKQMFHSDLLRLSGFHFRLDVEERFIDSSGLGTDFILSDEHLGGQIELILAKERGTLC